MRVLDLFCGCGGLSYGLSRAEFAGQRFEIVAALDHHEPSIKTFAPNHPTATPICVDIREADVNAVLDRVGPIDMVVGGPSCQGFSTHGKRVADDPRNYLYCYFMRFVEELKPTWVLMENVTGLLRYRSGVFRDSIVDDFVRLGYVVSFAQLQAADYGVPQIRKRVFFIANRRGIPFFFPRPTHAVAGSALPLPLTSPPKAAVRPYVTLANAIGDLPAIGRGCSKEEAPTEYACAPFSPYQAWVRDGSTKLSLHYGQQVPEGNYHRIVSIPPGGDWLDIPPELLPDRFARILRKDATTLYYRLRWDRPAYTITTVYRNVSSGAFTHPDEDRALTHREAARIQSFPDKFCFFESSLMRQIGNAVPPILASALGQSILVHDSQCRRIRSEADLTEFEQEVRSCEPIYAFPTSGTYETADLPLASRLPSCPPPLTDAQWTSIRTVLARSGVEDRSQVNLRGIVNAILHCRTNGNSLLAVPQRYSEPVTVVRVMHEWHERGILESLFQDLNAVLCRRADGHDQVSEYGGEKKPRRRARVRPNSTHHFATILYQVDPRTRCTSAEVGLQVSHG